MARLGNLPAEVAMVLHLKKVITKRRTEHLEKMASGIDDSQYREHVGRAKEDAYLLELLGKELKNFDIDGDIDEQQSVTKGNRRSAS